MRTFFVPEKGFHLKLNNITGEERIHLFGGNGSNLPKIEFKNYVGETTIQLIGQGYGGVEK